MKGGHGLMLENNFQKTDFSMQSVYVYWKIATQFNGSHTAPRKTSLGTAIGLKRFRSSMHNSIPLLQRYKLQLYSKYTFISNMFRYLIAM